MLAVRQKRYMRTYEKITYGIMGLSSVLFAIDYCAHFSIVNKNNSIMDLSTKFNTAFTRMIETPFDFTGLDLSKFLPVTAFCFIIAALLLYDAYARRSERRVMDQNKLQGSAKFMDQRDIDNFNKRFNEPYGKANFDGKNNFVVTQKTALGMDNKKTKRNLNFLVIGGSGSGKSMFYAVPNLLKANCNYIVTDPSGELLNGYGKYLENRGYDVKVINLSTLKNTNCYNPMWYVKDDKEALILVDTLIENTTPKGEGSSEPFWVNSEKLLLKALVLYLLHYRPKEDQNFYRVTKMLNLADIDENNSTAGTKLDELFMEVEEGDLAKEQYEGFKKAAGRTAKSIIISCMSRMQVFFLPEVEYITSNDDIDLNTISDHKSAIFLILPTGEGTFNFIASMLYSQIFTLSYKYAETNAKYGYIIKYGDDVLTTFQAKDVNDSMNAKLQAEEFVESCKNLDNLYIDYNVERSRYDIIHRRYGTLTWRGTEENALKVMNLLVNDIRYEPAGNISEPTGHLPIHLRLLMDEFANVNNIPDFNPKLSTIRKYWISADIIIQNLAQIRALYKDETDTLVGNCDNILFLGSPDKETAKWLSETLGKATVKGEGRSYQANANENQNINRVQRDLITPDEIMSMSDKECIYICRGNNESNDDSNYEATRNIYYGKKIATMAYPEFAEAQKTANTFIVDTNTSFDEFVSKKAAEEELKNLEKIKNVLKNKLMSKEVENRIREKKAELNKQNRTIDGKEIFSDYVAVTEENIKKLNPRPEYGLVFSLAGKEKSEEEKNNAKFLDDFPIVESVITNITTNDYTTY